MGNRSRLAVVVIALAGVTLFFAFTRAKPSSGRAATHALNATAPSAGGAQCEPGRAVTHKTPPPRFNALPASTTYRDPTSLDYNQRRMTNDDGMTASQVFAAEPRDPVWAGKMEKGMGEWLGEMLTRRFPNVKDFTFECKSKTCRVMYRANRADRNPSRDAIDSYAPAPSIGYQTNPDPNVEEEYLFYFGAKSPGQLSADALVAKVSRHREMVDSHH